MTNKAVFLDRDGVINIDHSYVCKVEDFDFMPGIFEFCRHIKKLGYKIVVVTNQSGIGRGYYSENDFLTLSDWMKQQFINNDCALDAVYYCPYHPEKALPPYLKNSDWRKPAPGMLLQAIKDYDLTPSQCVMIGDNESDIQAADAAGVARKILLDTQNNTSLNKTGADEVWQSLVAGLKDF
jgi:D-glycero-D-manno-heptose 1,7-bisphosphate phosphatase